MEHQILLLLVLISTVGIGAQWLAWRLGIPTIVILLAAGFALGPATGILNPSDDFGAFVGAGISGAVSIIVLEGGLGLNFAELRAAGQGVLRLVGIGVPLGWVLGALAAHFIGGLSWPISVLLGAMLVITGPTVITPLLRQAKLARRTASLLKWEGVLNDAIGAILTVIVLEFLLSLNAAQQLESTMIETSVNLLLGVTAGMGLGIGAAFLAGFAFSREYVPEFLKAPTVLAGAVLIYGAADTVQAESGLIAVALFGIGLANMKLPEIEDLRKFKESLSVFLVGALFIVLTADLDFGVFAELSRSTVAFILLVVFVLRPAAIYFATLGTALTWQERVFVAFIAPRGIVVAALAGLSGAVLAGSGIQDAEKIVPLVFSIIIGTVVVHGFVVGPLARALGLASDQRPGLIIVGANDWSVALARTLKAIGTPVLLSDSSAKVMPADAIDLPMHEGHILASRSDDPEELKDFEFLLAASADDAFNALVCVRFAPELGQQHVNQLAYARNDAHNLDLSREWRGKIVIHRDVTLDTLLRRLEQGWTFRVETLGDEDRADHLSVRPESRLPVVLCKDDGELRFISPETKAPQHSQGKLVVFAAPDAEDVPTARSRPD